MQNADLSFPKWKVEAFIQTTPMVCLGFSPFLRVIPCIRYAGAGNLQDRLYRLERRRGEQVLTVHGCIGIRVVVVVVLLLLLLLVLVLVLDDDDDDGGPYIQAQWSRFIPFALHCPLFNIQAVVLHEDALGQVLCGGRTMQHVCIVNVSTCEAF